MTFAGKPVVAICLSFLLIVWLIKEVNLTPSLDNSFVTATPKAVIDIATNTNTYGQVINALVPARLERDAIATAARDPFGSIQVLALPVPPKLTPTKTMVLTPTPTAIVAVPPSVPVMAAPAPSAPPLNLRFAGRMTNPDGQQMIFAMLAEQAITLSVGQDLPNGYHVDSISERMVKLTFTALGTTASLDLPEPPKYEIR
jgi:hypothetical protein